MKKYLTLTIGTAFKTKNNFNEKFQQILDEYAKKGYTLHSYHFASDVFCTIVFERESEDNYE